MERNKSWSATEKALREILGDGLAVDQPMSRHTTIGAGGNARLLAVPRSEKQVIETIGYAISEKLEYVVLGKGSNLIVRDGGYDGLIIKMGAPLSKTRLNRRTVFAGAGASFARLSRNVTKAGRTGMEFGIGIPGTVGGAVAMNAGAWGGDVSGIFVRAKIVDGNGAVRVLKAGDVRFGYRKADLPAGCVILSATFACPPGEIDQSTYARVLSRKDTQPISQRTFGSTFVNPPGGYAGQMIEACGLKGKRVGGAVISEKHANFIVNAEGKASASDVESLIELMRREVRKKFGITLKTEVVIIGNR